MSVIDHAPEVEVLEDQHGTRVHVLGDITTRNSAEVSAAVQSALEEKGRLRRLVLDLSGVQHIDSSGIGALMEIQQRMQSANTRLVLTGMEEAPRKLLERTGISRLFDIRADDTTVVLPASRRKQERLLDARVEAMPKRKRPHSGLWMLLWFCLIVGGLSGIGVAAYPTLQNYRAQLDQVPILSGMLRAVDQRVQAVEQSWKDQVAKIEAKLNGNVRAARRHAESLVAGSEKRLQADMDKRAGELKTRLDAVEAAQRETDARLADLQQQRAQESAPNNGAKGGQEQ
jgi:anti-anti-sigma factor